MNIKSAKILPVLCCLLAALFLLPANVFSIKPADPVPTIDIIGFGLVVPSGGIYKKNNMVPIEAIADEGWLFDHWEGVASGEFVEHDEEKVAAGLIGGVDGLWLQFLVFGDSYRLYENVETYVTTLLDGLRPGRS